MDTEIDLLQKGEIVIKCWVGAGERVFATGRLSFGEDGTSKPTGNLSPQKQTQTHTNDKYFIKENANTHK